MIASEGLFLYFRHILSLLHYNNTIHTDVPFFGNTDDNTHCYQAVIRMMLNYYLPQEDFSWEKLDKMSAKKKDKWTWPTQMLLNLKKEGFDIIVIDPFDFKTFVQRGEPFLLELWGKEMGEAQIHNSDIEHERALFRLYEKAITAEQRAPTLNDISQLLERGYLIECNINSRILNEQEGYAGHSILIYGMDAHSIYLHDPGLPHHPHRKVSKALFTKAWMHPADGHQALTAIHYPSDAPMKK